MGSAAKNKIPCPCRELDTGRPARSLFTVLTELSQLSHSIVMVIKLIKKELIGICNIRVESQDVQHFRLKNIIRRHKAGDLGLREKVILKYSLESWIELAQNRHQLWLS
jgi:hypothetical protein